MAERAVKILHLIGKPAVTVGLLIFFSFMIARDYGKARLLFPERISLSNFIVDSGEVQSRARTTTLNHLIPSFGYLSEFEKGQEDFDRERFEGYAHYYRKVVEYIPGMADAYSMLGFCYYYLGRHEEAVSFYKKAVALNPHLFWPRYNLGIIFFKEGQYKKSMELFQQAIMTRPGVTWISLRTSKIYQDILREARYSNDALKEKLQAGYRDCRLLLGLSQYYLKNSTGVPSGMVNESEVAIRIF